MSVESIARVLNHSRAKGTAKLVLIGIANHDGDGGAWPSIKTLARYANATERTVQRSIEELVEMGELEVHRNEGGSRETREDRRPNRYILRVTDGVTPMSPREGDGVTPVTPRGDAGDVNGVTPTSPEPSLNHPEPGGATDSATTATILPLHPDRCPTHQTDPCPPPCHGCRIARETVERTREEARAAAAAEARAARAEAARLRALEIANCTMCDDRGYLGPLVCNHNPDGHAVNAAGIAAVKAALAAARSDEVEATG